MSRKVLALILGMVLLMTAVPVNAESDVTAGIASDTDILVPSEPAEAPEVTEPEGEEPTEVAPETTAQPEENSAEPTETAPVEDKADETEEPVRASSYRRGADGQLLLDDDGNPIPILPEDATEKPVAWQRDASGALVLDAWGEPIPTKYIDIAAEKLYTIEDVLNPARRIEIYALWGEGDLYFGMEAALMAVLQGYDGLIYTLQWETCPFDRLMAAGEEDATIWMSVPGAVYDTYELVVTKENYLDFWRVKVTITGVDQEAF